jgi:hypothetical protein
MNNITVINRYLYNINKEAMFITITEVFEDTRIPMRVNIHQIKYFTRVVDETGDKEHFGTFIYLAGGDDYVHAEEEASVIIKRINNAINRPLFNFN